MAHFYITKLAKIARMHNIKTISNPELLKQTLDLALEERRITLLLLEHLREIERRMLFAEMGYASLFEFCTKHLGLSEGSTYRRISAMQLIRDVPEAKESIQNGKLSLSNATLAQNFFRAERKNGKAIPTRRKKEILGQLEGLSKRGCEQRLFEISPTAIPRESERIVSATETELKLIVDERFMGMIRNLKDLLAHRFPRPSNTEIFDYSLTETLKKLLKEKMGPPRAA